MTRAVRTTDSTPRFPGGVHSPSTVADLSRRDRVLISTCLAVITALAWVYLVHLERQMSSSMEYDTMMAKMGMTKEMSWTAADVFFTFAMWAVMMVGMMAGTAAPVLLLFAAARAGRSGRSLKGDGGVRLAVLMFGLGYITVWIGFSLCAALAQWALHQTAMLSPAMAASSPYLAGAILIVAGAYQLTPWKGACLAQCRSPLGFLMTNWRDGRLGALQMGVRHGVYCLGCCWALMCVLFAVGVMNLVWVAALTGFVLLEKIGPAGAIVARVAGAAMVLVGVFLIAAKV
jgi:predicted metal-binding membrane protein